MSNRINTSFARMCRKDEDGKERQGTVGNGKSRERNNNNNWYSSIFKCEERVREMKSNVKELKKRGGVKPY